jgi:glycosyltransferase involved in cell wall biosynthesis
MDNASVIINTFNGNQKWLLDAVMSYVNQLDINVQIIISTVVGDKSIETLKEIPGVEFCINKKPGIYSQLNNALPLIKNEWFCYAAGDDIAVETKVRDEINACKSSGAKICASGFFITDSNLKETNRYGTDMKYDISEHLSRNMISDCALMHSSLIKRYGPFDPSCGNHGFWDFWLRIGKEHPEYFLLDKTPRWHYRQHSDAKHAARKRDSAKIDKNERERKVMLKKHLDLLKKYGKEKLLKVRKYK